MRCELCSTLWSLGRSGCLSPASSIATIRFVWLTKMHSAGCQNHVNLKKPEKPKKTVGFLKISQAVLEFLNQAPSTTCRWISSSLAVIWPKCQSWPASISHHMISYITWLLAQCSKKGLNGLRLERSLMVHRLTASLVRKGRRLGKWHVFQERRQRNYSTRPLVVVLVESTSARSWQARSPGSQTLGFRLVTQISKVFSLWALIRWLIRCENCLEEPAFI